MTQSGHRLLPASYFQSASLTPTMPVPEGWERAMRRRDFITLVGSAAVAWPLPARAQQPAMPVIGFLHIASSGAYVHVVAAFRRGLMENDLVEGRNITVEYRSGESQLDRMPSLLADLLDHQPSVIVASLQGAQAAKSAGVTIPVVFSSSDDPVKQGFCGDTESAWRQHDRSLSIHRGT